MDQAPLFVGKAENIDGEVTLKDAQGNLKPLMAGDQVALSDTVITNPNSSVQVLDSQTGQPVLSVSKGSRVFIDESVVPGMLSEESLADEAAIDVETLQQMVEQGLFEELEETAAGDSAGPSSALAEAKFAIESGSEGEVTAEFETQSTEQVNEFAQDEALRTATAPAQEITTLANNEPAAETPAEETPAEATAEEAGAEETPAEETPAEETPAEETPAEETPAEEPPAEQPPAEQPPAEETPAEETPAEETPAEETPAEEPPAEEPPAEQPPAEQPPAEEPPAEEPPAEQPPAEEPPAEEPPAEEPPAEEPPAEQPPAEEPPAEEPPAEEPPAEQPPAEQPPVEQPPVEQPPVEEPPVEEPPVEEPPVEEPPAEQPPVEQPPAEVPTKSVMLLEESFENLQTSKGWHVEKGDVTGDHGVVWDTGKNGLEVQSKIVSKSSDGSVHAELDAHHNVSMSTDVPLNGASNVNFSIDVKPREGGARRGHKDTSDAQIEFDGKTVQILSDAKGNLTFVSEDDSVTVEMSEAANGWTTVEINYSEISAETPTLTIEGIGADDSYGALIDNIKMTGEVPVAEVAQKSADADQNVFEEYQDALESVYSEKEDVKDAQAAYRETKAEHAAIIKQEKSEFQQAKGEFKEARQELKEAQKEVRQAEKELKQAKKHGSEEEVEQAKQALAAAKTHLNEEKQEFSEAKQTLKDEKQDIKEASQEQKAALKEAKLDIKEQQAELKEAKEDLRESQQQLKAHKQELLQEGRAEIKAEQAEFKQERAEYKEAQQDIREAKSEFKQSRRSGDEERIEEAKQQLEQAKQEAKEELADVKEAKADVKEAKQELAEDLREFKDLKKDAENKAKLAMAKEEEASEPEIGLFGFLADDDHNLLGEHPQHEAPADDNPFAGFTDPLDISEIISDDKGAHSLDQYLAIGGDEALQTEHTPSEPQPDSEQQHPHLMDHKQDQGGLIDDTHIDFDGF